MNRILIAEVNGDDVALLRSHFEAQGWSVELAASGTIALAKARRDPPSVVLSEVALPGLDGLTLVRRLRSNPRFDQTRIVLYTGSCTEPEDEDIALSFGADALVRKQVAVEVLQRRLEELLTRPPGSTPRRPRQPDRFPLDLWASALVVSTDRGAAATSDPGFAARMPTEAHIRLALEASGVGLWYWDVPSGRVVWSLHHLRLFGINPDGFDGRVETFWSRVHPDDLAEVDRKMARARQDRTLYETEYRVVWPDGSVHWIRAQGLFVYDSAGNAVEMAGLVMDISERKVAEQAQRETAYLLGESQRIANVGSWNLDLATHRVRWTREMFAIFGLPTADAMTHTQFMQLVYPSDRPALAAWDAACIAGLRPESIEFRAVRPDGSVRFLLASGDLQVDGAGRPISTVGVVQDITERKRVEWALRASAERLAELSKRVIEVEETERRNINRELHDRIGQSLSALGVSLSSLRLALPKGALRAVDRQLDAIQAMVEETAASVRDVMAELHPPALDDYGLLAALRVHAESCTQGTDLGIEVRGHDPQPRLERSVEMALFRIAQEAIANALHHAQARRIEVALEAEGSRVRLSVRDDGRGLGQGETDKPGKHWGIRIMRERAEAMGAQLDIRSEPGSGTRVEIDLARVSS